MQSDFSVPFGGLSLKITEMFILKDILFLVEDRMSEELIKEKSKLSILQITLLVLLYVLITASIVLGIAATGNLGQEGYDGCMEKICIDHPSWCTKFRTMNNCCMGTGGKMGIIDNEYVCVFD